MAANNPGLIKWYRHEAEDAIVAALTEDLEGVPDEAIEVVREFVKEELGRLFIIMANRLPEIVDVMKRKGLTHAG